MKIELLYFDGCPSWQTALDNLQAVLEEKSITDSIQVMKIEDNEQAEQERFLGSPTIRIDGVDLWPDDRADYSVSCRIYVTPKGVKGWPTIDMLRMRINQIVSF